MTARAATASSTPPPGPLADLITSSPGVRRVVTPVSPKSGGLLVSTRAAAASSSRTLQSSDVFTQANSDHAVAALHGHGEIGLNGVHEGVGVAGPEDARDAQGAGGALDHQLG